MGGDFRGIRKERIKEGGVKSRLRVEGEELNDVASSCRYGVFLPCSIHLYATMVLGSYLRVVYCVSSRGDLRSAILRSSDVSLLQSFEHIVER